VNNKENIIVKMTVRELFDKYITSKTMEVKKSTLVKITDEFNHYISPTFEKIYIDKITSQIVENWRLKLVNRSKKLSLNTKRHAFITFKSMIKYAVKMGYLNKNPFEYISNFKDTESIKNEMSYYTKRQFKKFLRVAKKFAKHKQKNKKDFSEWNYYVFFAIAFYTGLRKGEIHALKWSDIKGSFFIKYLDIKRSINQRLNIETSPKTKNSERIIRIPIRLIIILYFHRKRLQRLKNFSEDFRICNNIRNTTIKIKNELYAKTANLKIIRIHDFRHSHVSVLINSRINIKEIAKRVGHARVEETWNTYSHMYHHEEEKLMQVFDGFILTYLTRFLHVLFKIFKKRN
jgi:integrase